ncbi:MAG: hypothetical protein N2319_11700 [Candidatus Kapabacteria bacterium]|nr:hypothetical protein [Candidatus Kapabacteria bacterium]
MRNLFLILIILMSFGIITAQDKDKKQNIIFQMLMDEQNIPEKTNKLEPNKIIQKKSLNLIKEVNPLKNRILDLMIEGNQEKEIKTNKLKPKIEIKEYYK